MVTVNKQYKIKSSVKVLKDASSVKFHVDNNDYFGTAATLIHLMHEQLAEQIKKAPAKDRALVNKAFKNLEQDLILLQKDYQIKAKQKASHKLAKGRLKSQ
ncbi:MAG: hypothetical protein PHE20_04465 [Patescibacteria group bacterium]|nr:hypothetical protein [Patescibacteria group bacterium]